MTTPIRAHFDGQYFVPDEPVVGLAPGDVVQIVATSPPSPTTDQTESKKSALRWLADHPIDSADLPSDLSHQHDHYLYGTPKRPN